MKQGKTPGYVRKAIEKYNDKFERLTIRLEKGTGDRIKKYGFKSVNEYVNLLINEDLKRREEATESAQEEPQTATRSEEQPQDETPAEGRTRSHKATKPAHGPEGAAPGPLDYLTGLSWTGQADIDPEELPFK